jgi:hypothetical protein
MDRVTLAADYEDAPDARPLLPPDLPSLHSSFTNNLHLNSPSSLTTLLSPEVRLQEARSPSAPGLQGITNVSRKLVEVCGKMSGIIQNPSIPGILMRSNVETRSMLTLKKGFITLSLGVSIVWKGGYVVLVVLAKSADGASFMEDDTVAPAAVGPAATASAATASAAAAPPPASQPPTTALEPPYLIPRPTTFPPPTLTIEVLSCASLVNAPISLRPVNSYVKLKLPSGPRHKTAVKKMSNNPTFGSNDDNKASFAVTKTDEYFDVQILDWKPIKHRLLGEFRVSLGQFSSKSHQMISNSFDMRWKKGSRGECRFNVSYEDVESWWQNEERNARDEKVRIEREKEEEEEEEERAKEKGGEEGNVAAKERTSESANCGIM